jgi:hypothetical protein
MHSKTLIGVTVLTVMRGRPVPWGGGTGRGEPGSGVCRRGQFPDCSHHIVIACPRIALLELPLLLGLCSLATAKTATIAYRQSS